MQKKDKIKGKKALFVLGLGLGYQVSALRDRKDDEARIYAIERYSDVFERAFATQEWQEDMGSDVEFWIGEDMDQVISHLDQITQNMEDEEWDIITNQPSIKLDPKYYKTMLKAWRKRKAAAATNS